MARLYEPVMIGLGGGWISFRGFESAASDGGPIGYVQEWRCYLVPGRKRSNPSSGWASRHFFDTKIFWRRRFEPFFRKIAGQCRVLGRIFAQGLPFIPGKKWASR